MVKRTPRHPLDGSVGTRHRRRLGSAAALLLGIAGIALTAACGTSASAANSMARTSTAAAGSPAGTITEGGSSLLLPLMQDWASAYHQQVPGVTVQTSGGGSTEGITNAAKGTWGIGASDAYLSSGDVLVNPGLLNIPLAVSAQSVIFNLPSLKNPPTPLKLTGDILAKMYSGQITMWNDPQIAAINGQLTLPAVRVVPLHRVEGSGDTFLFTSYLATQNSDWDTKVGYGTVVNWPANIGQTVVGSKGMYTTCGQVVGCVGYNGVSYLQQEQPLGISQAAVQNGAGHFSVPGAKTIQNELARFIALTPRGETIAMIAGTGGYPLINFEYAIVKTRQPSAAAAARVKAFLQWVITSPQATSMVTAPSINFQPLPPDVQKLSMAQIGEIR